MTTAIEPTAYRPTLTIPQAARDLGVNSATLYRWIVAGKLAAFVPPGKAIGDGTPGPKGCRIFREDWERFKRERMTTTRADQPGKEGA